MKFPRSCSPTTSAIGSGDRSRPSWMWQSGGGLRHCKIPERNFFPAAQQLTKLFHRVSPNAGPASRLGLHSRTSPPFGYDDLGPTDSFSRGQTVRATLVSTPSNPDTRGPTTGLRSSRSTPAPDHTITRSTNYHAVPGGEQGPTATGPPAPDLLNASSTISRPFDIVLAKE